MILLYLILGEAPGVACWIVFYIEFWLIFFFFLKKIFLAFVTQGTH